MFKRSLLARLLPGLAVLGVLVASLMAGPLGLFGSLAGYGYGACGYGYAYTGTPQVTGVSPNFGSTGGGLTVTITGSGFCNSLLAVQFGGVNSTGLPDVISDSQVQAVSPAHAAGTVDVRVITTAGTSPTSTADHFTFIVSGPGTFNPLPPTRVLDTRVSGPKLGAGSSRTLIMAGISVPANATAVVVNATVANTTARSYLTVYPTAGTRPLASNLNWVATQVVANLVMVNLGAGGAITVYNNAGSTNAILDLEGYYAPSSGGTAGGFVALPPARITDTRTGSGQPNAGLHIGPGGRLNVQVTGRGGVPLTGAAAVVLNATVTRTTLHSYLTAYGTGTSQPLASNVNWVRAGQTIANRVVVPIGAGGKVTFYNHVGRTDLVVDVNGYFTDATASGAQFVGVTPSRLIDTRNGTGRPAGKIGPAGTITVQVSGNGGVPAMGSSTPPSAVVVNVTITQPNTGGYVTVYPGAPRPLASDLNFLTQQTVPNLVVVRLSGTGTINIFANSGATHLIVDVVGWFG